MSSIKESFKEGKENVVQEISEAKEKVGATITSGVKKTKSFLRKLITYVLLLVVLFGIGYVLYCNYTYSSGTRTGVLVKVSEKGFVFKTYEGQLNLGGFSTDVESGMIGNVWNFSVTNDAVYKKIQTLEGKKVKLSYREKNKAMPWQGDTNYFIEDVVLSE